jgi:hypothetical protein
VGPPPRGEEEASPGPAAAPTRARDAADVRAGAWRGR